MQSHEPDKERQVIITTIHTDLLNPINQFLKDHKRNKQDVCINPHETFKKIIKQCQVYLTYGVLDLEKVRAAIQDNSIALRVLDGNVNRLNAKDSYFGVELSKGDIINRNLIIILHEAEQLQSKQKLSHPHPLYLSAKSLFACKIDTAELDKPPENENVDSPTPRREK